AQAQPLHGVIRESNPVEYPAIETFIGFRSRYTNGLGPKGIEQGTHRWRREADTLTLEIIEVFYFLFRADDARVVRVQIQHLDSVEFVIHVPVFVKRQQNLRSRLGALKDKGKLHHGHSGESAWCGPGHAPAQIGNPAL